MATYKKHPLFGLYLSFIALVINSRTGASPLYTFNASTQEMKPTEGHTHLVSCTAPIIYLGRTYNSFHISTDGFIAFSNDTTHVQYIDQDWSDPNVSPFIDIPFIAPFYYKGQSLSQIQDYTGHIMFQELNQSVEVRHTSDLDKYIQSQVLGSANFKAKYGIAITWRNVTSSDLVSYDRCHGTSQDPCLTNTFQLVLLTDGTQSYAIINYASLDVELAKFYQAGFNGGAKLGWTPIIPNLNSSRHLALNRGSDTVGRYIFRISSGVIFRGGCYSDPLNTDLSIHPNYAGMYGGKMIDVAGPCFPDNENILCQFESSISSAIFVSQSHIRCTVPRLLIRDRVKLSVSTDNGGSYRYYTSITIVLPSQIAANETVLTDGASSKFQSPNITLTWTPEILSNANALVDITLIGYSEREGKSSYTKLATLATGVPVNKGQQGHIIDMRDLQCEALDDCFHYEVGLIEVRLQNRSNAQKYQFISSNAFPLAYYFQKEMTTKHGSKWPSTMCQNWYNREKQDTTWVDNLLYCPCSLTQALLDFGRWQPDSMCNIANSNKMENCFYHTGAVHCVRSVYPRKLAGNQCCYGKNGSLMFAADSRFGSTPDRSHSWGEVPYGKPECVPILSNYLSEVVPLQYCCEWTENCDNYMDVRPTRDCTGYIPPKPAQVFGLGHIRTFNGTTYRIVGPGDYILLQADQTIVQGRFDKLQINPLNAGKNLPTTYVLKAVSVKDTHSSDTVDLRLKEYQSGVHHGGIDVRVNGHYTLFDERPMRWQYFNGVSVLHAVVDGSPTQSNYTVMLTNGISFQVKELHGSLQLDLLLPVDAFDTITGLFGDLNGNMKTSSGVTYEHSLDDSQKLHEKYELTWAVKDEVNSLFRDFQPANYSGHMIDFNIKPLSDIDENKAIKFCYNINECAFDYRHTGSQVYANGTRLADDRYMTLSLSLKPVRSCGLLNVPRSSKTNYGYTLGTQTTITGCKTGKLAGHTTYTCVETSNSTQAWTPSVTATCFFASTEESGIGLIVGVSVGCTVAVLIAIILALIAAKKQRRKRYMSKRSGEPKTDEELKVMHQAETKKEDKKIAENEK